MSNILTAYVRLLSKRPSEAHDWVEVAQHVLAVGSYWVPAAASSNTPEVIDIRYGCAKQTDDPLDDPQLRKRFHVWRRLAIGGGWDDTLNTPTDQHETCTYGFDTVEVESLDRLERYSSDGTYAACNDWSRVDLSDPRSSACAPWIPGLDPTEPPPDSSVTDSEHPLVQKYFLKPLDPREIREVRLLWRGRIVHRRSWDATEKSAREDGIDNGFCDHGNDGWDNLRNPAWLEFMETWSTRG